jgi:hypothetical protein
MSQTYYEINSFHSPGELPGEPPGDRINGFPIDSETVIGGQAALEAIEKAIGQMEDFRDSRLHLFKTIVGPLLPDNIRSMIEEQGLNDYSIAYNSLVKLGGNLAGAHVLLGMDEKVESVKSQQRILILPFLENELKQKVKRLEKRKPFGWKRLRKFYQKNVEALSIVVDNLMNLMALAWTFCPGIEEPKPGTGFYNRYVLTGNGGFVDMGHFFNSAVIAYLYGPEEARRRSEETEMEQRRLRENKWLVEMKKRSGAHLLSNLFWGFATSADTIEDRASGQFGILLGDYMRNSGDNGKIIDYFTEVYPSLVYDAVKNLGKRKSTIGNILDTIAMAFRLLRRMPGNGKKVDIYEYMKKFYNDYDAIDPKNGNEVPRGLVERIVRFYEEKYNSDEWQKYGSRECVVVIPQELWERVVRGRENFAEKALPIKIQLKDSGEIVDRYQGNPPVSS